MANQGVTMGGQSHDGLEILCALHSQVERLGLRNEPLSPTENQLANAILVLLNVLIAERKPSLDAAYLATESELRGASINQNR